LHSKLPALVVLIILPEFGCGFNFENGLIVVFGRICSFQTYSPAIVPLYIVNSIYSLWFFKAAPFALQPET
jgi:hypothetical protein